MRLVYRPLDDSHCTATYLGWMNDPEVIRYLEIYEPYTESQLREYVARAAVDSQLLFWAIHLKDVGKHIGNIKIDPVNYHHGTGEYGIMIGDRTAWGKGYASEASLAILDYCFRQIGLRKITLGVVEENSAAVELYKRLGFVVEGIYKDHGFYNGHYCNLLRMAIFNKAIGE